MGCQKPILLFFALLLYQHAPAQVSSVFRAQNGLARFRSEAPLETIEARSGALTGAVDVRTLSFAFSIAVNSFEGFNSALQKEHFRENYLQTDRFANATFKGKIIEEIDFTAPGQYEIRAKGMLEIHGVPRERIIRCRIEVRPDGTWTARSGFMVPLSDHQIWIPKVVNQKIAEEILVEIEATFRPGTP